MLHDVQRAAGAAGPKLWSEIQVRRVLVFRACHPGQQTARQSCRQHWSKTEVCYVQANTGPRLLQLEQALTLPSHKLCQAQKMASKSKQQIDWTVLSELSLEDGEIMFENSNSKVRCNAAAPAYASL